MPTETPQHDFLVALFALQHGLIAPQQLVDAVAACDQTSLSAGQQLVRSGAVSSTEYDVLRQLATMALKRHDNDILATVSALDRVDIPWEDLQASASPEISQTLKSITQHKQDHTIDYDYSDTGSASLSTALGKPSSVDNRFRIVRFHRRGGLGYVSLAEDLELHRRVAVKQIRQEHVEYPEQQARFLLEAEITGGLEHPNIVPVYGLGIDGQGYPFYAMKFIRGESFKDAVSDFHRSAEQQVDPGIVQLRRQQLLRRFIDVCHALQYAHNRGVLHRDIKPSNIMLGRYGETLVVDWGLARPLQVTPPPATDRDSDEPMLHPPSASGTSPDPDGMAIGTPRYMAPEQAAGHINQLGPWTDIYALGGTLYTLLTGRCAFDGNDVQEILDRVREGRFLQPHAVTPNVPRALEAICLKAMAHKPEDRYASALEMAEDIERWIADEPVSAWCEPWTYRARRWARKHQTFVTGTVATVTVALAVSLVAAYLLNQAWSRAEANFQLAKSAVDQSFTEISENALLNQRGMQPLRTQLLQHASSFYARFEEMEADDHDTRAEAARTMFRMGRIHELTGDFAAARDAYQRAIDKQTELSNAPQATSQDRADLAFTWNALARLLDNHADIDTATDAYEQAIALRRELAEDTPDNEQFQRWLANTEMNLGQLAQRQEHYEIARSLLEASQQRRQDFLVDAASDTVSAEFSLDLAKGFYNLGVWHYQAPDGDRNQARNYFQLAIERCRTLLEQSPHDFAYIREMSASQRMLADVLFELGEGKNASSLYREAIPALRQLAFANPTVTEYAKDLAGCYMNLAKLWDDGVESPPPLSGESSLLFWNYAEQLLAPLQRSLPTREDVQVDYAQAATHLARSMYAAARETAPQLVPENPLVMARRADETYSALHARKSLDQNVISHWVATLELMGQLQGTRPQDWEQESTYARAIQLQWTVLDGLSPGTPEYVRQATRLRNMLTAVVQSQVDRNAQDAAWTTLQDARENLTKRNPADDLAVATALVFVEKSLAHFGYLWDRPRQDVETHLDGAEEVLNGLLKMQPAGRPEIEAALRDIQQRRALLDQPRPAAADDNAIGRQPAD